MTEEIINLKDYFVHHYDDWGRLYCVEFKGSPLELENNIIRLEQERDELKFENDRYKQLLKGCPTEDEDCGLCVIDEQNKRLKQENKELKSETLQWKQIKDMANNNKYRSALEEIREKVKNPITLSCFASAKFVLEQIDKKINEVLNG